MTLPHTHYRAQHVGMARAYIHQFNDKATGTGGSNVLPALQVCCRGGGVTGCTLGWWCFWVKYGLGVH